MSTANQVRLVLDDGTEYVGPPLDEPCSECGAAVGEPCKPDEDEPNH